MSDDTRPVTVTLPWSQWVQLCSGLILGCQAATPDGTATYTGFVGLIHRERHAQYPDVVTEYPRDLPRRRQLERARKRRAAVSQ